jgi:tetratricopeptide (TPR) repeat protein
VDAGHPLLRLLEVQRALRDGKPDRARAALDAFFALGGDDYDARLLQAEFLRRDGRKEEFVATLEKARTLWPYSSLPLEHLRRYYMAEQRTDDALKMLELEARLAPKSIPLRLQLAKEYVTRARDKEAIQVLEDAMNVTPFVKEIHAAAVPLYRKTANPKKAVRSARCLVALRGEQDADEDMADRWILLSECLLEDGQAKEAAIALAEAEKLAPEEFQDRRAELKKKLGQ